MKILEEHYKKNFDRLVKRYTFWAGSVQNAEDVVQTAYTRAIQYYDSYDEKQDFGKWFNRILTNSLKMQKQIDRGQFHDEFDEEQVDGVSDYHYLGQLRREVVQEINSYEDNHREVLSLFFVNGYSPRSIVKVTDQKFHNVKTIIDRFKRKIREKYGDLNEGVHS